MRPEVEVVALELANEWLRTAPSDRRAIPRRIEERLERLHELTRGDQRRCYCCSAPHHDMRCPARKP